MKFPVSENTTTLLSGYAVGDAVGDGACTTTKPQGVLNSLRGVLLLLPRIANMACALFFRYILRNSGHFVPAFSPGAYRYIFYMSLGATLCRSVLSATVFRALVAFPGSEARNLFATGDSSRGCFSCICDFVRTFFSCFSHSWHGTISCDIQDSSFCSALDKNKNNLVFFLSDRMYIA